MYDGATLRVSFNATVGSRSAGTDVSELFLVKDERVFVAPFAPPGARVAETDRALFVPERSSAPCHRAGSTAASAALNVSGSSSIG